jgi:hypothetical protein
MKKFFFTTAVVFASFTALQAQDAMFQTFNEYDDISVVSVKKALLARVSDMNIGKTKVKDLSSKLDLVEIYSCEKAKTIKIMKAEIKQATADWEVLMTIKDEGSITFYGIKGENADYRELIMVTEDGNEYSIIRLAGKFSMKDVEKIVVN